MRTFEQALQDYQQDSHIQGITSQMVQHSLERCADIDFSTEPEFTATETFLAEDAKKALMLEDLLRMYLESAYPEFFIEEN